MVVKERAGIRIDARFKADVFIKHNRLDLLLSNKKEGVIALIEMSITYQYHV